jgi:hypothetical protein
VHAAPPDRVPLEDFGPLPAASKVEPSPAARALRERILGPHADDPRYVTLHWTGVSSFIVTINGHLFLFDAWEIVGIHKDYVPIGREELAGIEPEAILLGHGHFDHAADAGYVAGRTGAAVIASQEQCTTIKADAARDGNEGKFTCVITGTQEEPDFGTLTSLRLFEDLDPITILKSVHSAVRPPSMSNQLDPFLPVGDPTPYVENFNGSPEELALFLGTLRDPEGGTRMYHLRIGDFTLLVGDSAGPIFEYPEVRANLNRFPDCVDVMANAILGFDQPVSGLQDPVLFVANAHPRLFIPTHADAWAPALSAGQAAFKDELATELAALPNPPEVDHLLDPQDYVKERAYRVDDPKWVEPMAGSSCAGKAQARGRAGRIRLRVRPRRVRTGERRRFAFRAIAGGHSVAGATVRFAGRTARTDRRGRARISRALRSPRIYRARASKTGLRSGTARVRGVRSGRAPRFTG